jgi:AhpD family alkylhydroperoxidase
MAHPFSHLLCEIYRRSAVSPNACDRTAPESAVLITGFVDLRNLLDRGELTGVEREIVALAVSLENDCDYCMAAHSSFALVQTADADAVLDSAFRPQAWAKATV